MKRKTLIEVTERTSFKRCRRKWSLRFRDSWQRVATAPTSKAWMGSALHVGLEWYYGRLLHHLRETKRDLFACDVAHDTAKQAHEVGRVQLIEYIRGKFDEETREAMLPEDLDALQERFETVVDVFDRYFEFSREHDRWQILGVEKPLVAQISGTIKRLYGRVDLLVADSNGIYVVDFKSRDTFSDPTTLDLNDQITAYLWLAWQKTGRVPCGAIFREMRRKIPSEPKLLQPRKKADKEAVERGEVELKNVSPGLSRAACDTTYEIFRDAIVENGFDVEDYADLLDSLATNAFFQDFHVQRSRDELEEFGNWLPQEAAEMSRPSTPAYPNQTRDCAWDCEFLDVCVAMNERSDHSFILETNFEKRNTAKE